MTSNVHKRLDKLRKEIVDLGSKGRAFHFIVGDANEAAEAKLERMKAEGTIATGDEYQLVQIPWAISPRLSSGSSHIPEGSTHDPLVEPELPAPQAIALSWGEEQARQQKWKDHVRKIEAAGERYDPDKPKYGDGIV